ncbi:hypothetical protein vBKpnPEKp2_047 [Klebsiella phage vB_KpnP_EKp2]|uniref:Uncharacterized protein n=1 Tax=Klebsiella phage vB_KpnP_EKp2 TaxID=3065243 RepID=A0AAX4G5Q9_9CAUD|nr:hypothetical protein vBKpnPEKp2_047 [Klebsiella phage vB_KpnP_EKp2]
MMIISPSHCKTLRANIRRTYALIVNLTAP